MKVLASIECVTCGVMKSPDHFTKNDAARWGLKTSCRPCSNARTKAWKDANREIVRAAERRGQHCATYRRKYGIAKAEYKAMVAARMGRCDICSQVPFNGRKLVVDHCHTTGQVRGLLCNGCNSVLGFAKDDASRLRIAAAYLERAALHSGVRS